MENIFSALFFGKIIPHEQFVPKTEEYQEACKRYIHACTELEKEMKEKRPSLIPQFKETENKYMEVSRLEQAAAFELGFRLGVRLVAESYSKDTKRNEEKT